MDVKVYRKENVLQPSGMEDVYVPDVIDFIPEIVTDEEGNEIIMGFEELNSDKNILEQECALATIYQKGLDPLDLEEGIRWSEAILEEVNGIQLIQDIIEAVAKVSTSVHVIFSTVEDDKGMSYLTYKLSEVL